jgi:hypothetical protein
MRERSLSIVSKVLGAFILGLGGVSVFVLVGFYILAMYRHVPLAEEIVKAFKGDCLTLFLPSSIVFFINVLFSVAVTISGIAIVRLKEWGRRLLIKLITIETIWMLSDFVFLKRASETDDIVELAVMMGLLFFFSRSKSKRLFTK